MALAAVGAASAPTYVVALGCFGLIGLTNGPWVAAALEGCRQHSPDELRAQAFVTTSSLKIGAASLAGASAGLAGAAGGRMILLAAATPFVAAAVIPALDATLSRPARRQPDPTHKPTSGRTGSPTTQRAESHL